jgi:hypothetical protein
VEDVDGVGLVQGARQGAVVVVDKEDRKDRIISRAVRGVEVVEARSQRGIEGCYGAVSEIRSVLSNQDGRIWLDTERKCMWMV